MKKSTFIKRFVALLLVVLMSIDAFAAVVGDNDGAAFITKAEVDSMKTEFQSQLDRYNSSIDNKIDGAIASYLAGIRISRTLQIKPLIINYNDMVWKRKFDVYGSYRDWTSFVSSAITEGVWYEPKWEERQVIREPSHNFGVSETVTFNYLQGVSLAGPLRADLATSENIICNNYNTYNPCVWVLRCEYDKDDPITLEYKPMWKIGSNNNYLTSQPHAGYNNFGDSWTYSTNDGATWTNIGSNSSYMYAWTPIQDGETSQPWLQNGSPQTNDILNLYTIVRAKGAGDALLKQHHKLDANRFGIIIPTQYWAADVTADVSNSSWWRVDFQNPQIFSNLGGHIYAQCITTQKDAQQNQIRTFFYGDDSDLDVNIFRQDGTLMIGSAQAYKTTHSRFATLEWQPQTITVSSAWGDATLPTVGSSKSYGSPVSVIIKRPYFERYKLKNITSGLFKNGEYALKIGDGLPISTELTTSGNLKITFNYNINRLVNAVPSTANKIKVDVKKTSFLSGNDDYYTGRIDGGSEKRLKDVSSNDSVTAVGKKTTIEIEGVKEGEGVWLRIAPLATDLGLYAKISNLKVDLETDG